MNIVQRMKAPTPKFFRVLRNVGLALAAAGGYLTVAGAVATAVSQSAVDGETDNTNANDGT